VTSHRSKSLPAARSEENPREVQELDARLERLKRRLQQGDPDMTTDEIQAAIDRAEAKRRQLIGAFSEDTDAARVLSIVPKAAELYEQQIALGLTGNADATAEARFDPPGPASGTSPTDSGA
jgi:hypothetical protein